MVEAFGQPPAVVTSTNETAGVPSQLSVAVAVPVAGGEESSSHSMVTSAGKERIGSVASSSVMIWSSLIAFPQASVAVHVLVMMEALPQAPGPVHQKRK